MSVCLAMLVKLDQELRDTAPVSGLGPGSGRGERLGRGEDRSRSVATHHTRIEDPTYLLGNVFSLVDLLKLNKMLLASTTNNIYHHSI